MGLPPPRSAAVRRGRAAPGTRSPRPLGAAKRLLGVQEAACAKAEAAPGKRPAKARHRHRRGASENRYNSKHRPLLPYPQPSCPQVELTGRKARRTADSQPIYPPTASSDTDTGVCRRDPLFLPRPGAAPPGPALPGAGDAAALTSARWLRCASPPPGGAVELALLQPWRSGGCKWGGCRALCSQRRGWGPQGRVWGPQGRVWSPHGTGSECGWRGASRARRETKRAVLLWLRLGRNGRVCVRSVKLLGAGRGKAGIAGMQALVSELRGRVCRTLSRAVVSSEGWKDAGHGTRQILVTRDSRRACLLRL